MKELTIEQKAKAYDEALKVLHKYDGVNIMFSQSLKEEMFPELAESEDERIRKEIISLVQYTKGRRIGYEPRIAQDDMVAWLEKQGEPIDKIVKRAMNEKQRVLLTETNGNANIDWDTRSIQDVKLLLEYGLDYIKKLESQGEQKFSDIDNKFIRMRETKPKDISEFLDRLTTVEQEFLWEHIAKIRELNKEEQKPFDYEKAHVQQNDFVPKSAMEALKGEIVDNQNCVKPTNKVEPKFKVGEWVVDKNGTVQQILSYKDCIYKHTNGYSSKMFEDGWRLWDITKDAKDGDVLSYNDSRNNVWICIFKEYANERVYDYCTLDKESFWEYGNWNYLASFSYTPATKEQCDLLFQKMKESGYTWNVEKKELKKIENPIAWSEEDETMITDLSVIVHTYFSEISGIPFKYDLSEDKIRTWFKSLKDRVQLQQEWSEGDENRINRLIAYFEDKESFTAEDDIVYANWLKSLKDRVQPKQEWSEEDSPYYDDICEILINLLHSETANINKNVVQKDLDWLNSLKDRVQPKQEWTEEDEITRKALINLVEMFYGGCIDKTEKNRLLNFLNSIRLQSQWKPSDEQMSELRKYSDNPILRNLYYNLKKLKG